MLKLFKKLLLYYIYTEAIAVYSSMLQKTKSDNVIKHCRDMNLLVTPLFYKSRHWLNENLKEKVFVDENKFVYINVKYIKELINKLKG